MSGDSRMKNSNRREGEKEETKEETKNPKRKIACGFLKSYVWIKIFTEY